MPAPFTIKKSRYSEFRDIVNKRSLTRSFVISSLGVLNNQILVSFFPRDIEPGEIIAVDRPVVKHLDKEYTKTHCWHCLRSTQKYATVPCSMCSGVLFCSELCRKISQDTYHK